MTNKYLKGTWKWRLAQAIELKWWKNYLKNKPKADYLVWKKKYWRDLLKKIKHPLPTTSTAQILDTGCGPAGIFMVLDSAQVTAIDPLLEQYEASIEHFSKQDYPHVDFRPLPLEALTDKEIYNAVFCMNVINHVSDIQKSMDILVHAAKPKGYIIETIDAHNYPFFKGLFRLIPGDILHPHQYDLEEYKAMLTDRNCTILQCEQIKSEFFFNHYLIVAQKNEEVAPIN